MISALAGRNAPFGTSGSLTGDNSRLHSRSTCMKAILRHVTFLGPCFQFAF
jgi:hypothetical protein